MWSHNQKHIDAQMKALLEQAGGEPPVRSSDVVRRFRSAASGLWYENPHAAGTINAVELDGQILERKDGEQTMPWIRRAAEWASAIHSANDQAHRSALAETVERKGNDEKSKQ